MLALTMTSLTEMSPDEEAGGARATREQLEQKAYLSTRFSHYRSVVERVIGWMKMHSALVAGPIFVKQTKDLNRALLMTAILSNMALETDPGMYSSHFAPDGVDASSEDDDVASADVDGTVSDSGSQSRSGAE